MLNIQTYEGHIVSFNNENNALIQKAIVTIEPLQSGRGTPGINNFRAINGWNNIDIGVFHSIMMPPFVVIRVAVFCSPLYTPVMPTRRHYVGTTRRHHVGSFAHFLAVPLHRISK